MEALAMQKVAEEILFPLIKLSLVQTFLNPLSKQLSGSN